MKKNKFFLALFLSLVLTALPHLVLAQSFSNCPDGKLCNPLGTDSVQVLIGRVINAVLGVVGSIALLMFVYGGLTWMTSSGSQERVKKGKEIIIWSAIGLIVIFGAYGLVSFIINLATNSVS